MAKCRATNNAMMATTLMVIGAPGIAEVKKINVVCVVGRRRARAQPTPNIFFLFPLSLSFALLVALLFAPLFCFGLLWFGVWFVLLTITLKKKNKLTWIAMDFWANNAQKGTIVLTFLAMTAIRMMVFQTIVLESAL